MEISVFRPDARIVEASRNGIDFVNLTVFILAENGLHAVENADFPFGYSSGVHLGVDALASSFAADELDVFIADEVVEHPHGIAAAADTGQDSRGQFPFPFEDLLTRLQTDYIDLGMIHYVDSEEEWEQILHSEYLSYVMELKKTGVIHHIGLSSHNPKVAVKAAESGFVEMILFSVNPAFDMLPASEDIDTMFAERFDAGLKGIDAARAHLYSVCEQNDVGITVMKGFAGGRLFDEKRSPFGVCLTPVQCIHYALTRPAVCSILCGYDTKEQVDAAVAYETASAEEKDYASVLANAPFHSYRGQCTYCGHCKPCAAELDIAMINKFYDLATMQPEVPATIQSHYELLGHTASECIGCHACEARCPFGVPIARRMEQAAALFGR